MEDKRRWFWRLLPLLTKPQRILPHALFTCMCLSQSRHGDAVYVCLAGSFQRWKMKPGWTSAERPAGISLWFSAGQQKANMPSEVCHQESISNNSREKVPTTTVIPGNVHINPFARAKSGWSGFHSENPWQPRCQHTNIARQRHYLVRAGECHLWWATAYQSGRSLWCLCWEIPFQDEICHLGADSSTVDNLRVLSNSSSKTVFQPFLCLLNHLPTFPWIKGSKSR